MLWIYSQRTGKLFHGDTLAGSGYSGFGRGKNNPDFEKFADVGPIPAGLWLIQVPPFDSETHGPVCLRLVPERQTDTWGRSGFLIHGDSIQHPGSASHGCIILPRPVRLQVAASSDDQLLVLEYFQPALDDTVENHENSLTRNQQLTA
jgi:hypothetical protein